MDYPDLIDSGIEKVVTNLKRDVNVLEEKLNNISRYFKQSRPKYEQKEEVDVGW